MLIYAMEAWVLLGLEEEASEAEMVNNKEFRHHSDAMDWAWDRMEEGFAVRMYRRAPTPDKSK